MNYLYGELFILMSCLIVIYYFAMTFVRGVAPMELKHNKVFFITKIMLRWSIETEIMNQYFAKLFSCLIVYLMSCLIVKKTI